MQHIFFFRNNILIIYLLRITCRARVHYTHDVIASDEIFRALFKTNEMVKMNFVVMKLFYWWLQMQNTTTPRLNNKMENQAAGMLQVAGLNQRDVVSL